MGVLSVATNRIHSRLFLIKSNWESISETMEWGTIPQLYHRDCSSKETTMEAAQHSIHTALRCQRQNTKCIPSPFAVRVSTRYPLSDESFWVEILNRCPIRWSLHYDDMLSSELPYPSFKLMFGVVLSGLYPSSYS